MKQEAWLSVYQYMQEQASTLVQSNRLKLKSILKTIIFCGKQIISLREHQEQAEADVNPGDVCALLDFRVDAGDTVLTEHFKTGAQNAHTGRMI